MDNCPLSGVFLVCAERKLLRAASPFDPAFAKASAFVKTTAGQDGGQAGSGQAVSKQHEEVVLALGIHPLPCISSYVS